MLAEIPISAWQITNFINSSINSKCIHVNIWDETHAFLKSKQNTSVSHNQQLLVCLPEICILASFLYNGPGFFCVSDSIQEITQLKSLQFRRVLQMSNFQLSGGEISSTLHFDKIESKLSYGDILFFIKNTNMLPSILMQNISDVKMSSFFFHVIALGVSIIMLSNLICECLCPFQAAITE